MSSINPLPRPLTPPREDEEIVLYRPVWLSIAIETGLLMVAMLAVVVVDEFVGVPVPTDWRPLLNFGILLSPVILWVVFTWWAEQRVPEPRLQLITLFIVTALSANAIGMPVENGLLAPEDWLAQQSTLNRILGTTLSVAILHEFIKYLVLRYAVWPQHVRIRQDIIVYAVTVALAYATVVNLDFWLTNPIATPESMFLQVFKTYSQHLVASLILGFALTETQFGNAPALVMPVFLTSSAFVVGFATGLRIDFTNTVIGITISSPRLLFGALFSSAFYLGFISVLYFFFSVTARRADARLLQQGS